MASSSWLKVEMFLKLAKAGLLAKKSRLLIAILAVATQAIIVSGLVSVYADVGTKMSREFRSYGANLLVRPASNRLYLSEKTLAKAERILSDNKTVGFATVLYASAEIAAQPAVLVGTDMGEITKVFSYLEVKGKLPSLANEVALGSEVAKRLRLQPEQTVVVSYGESRQTFRVTGLISSGGAEDNQIFMSLEAAQNLAGKPGEVSLVYASVVDEGSRIKSLVKRLNSTDPEMLAEPVTKVSRSEGTVLKKIRFLMLLVAAVISITTVLSLATAMTASVLERRYEIGLRKALGADNRSIALEFLGESLTLGLVGGIAGCLMGYWFALWIGRSVFGLAIDFRSSGVVVALTASLLTCAFATLLPARAAMAIEPALVLKGE